MMGGERERLGESEGRNGDLLLHPGRLERERDCDRERVDDDDERMTRGRSSSFSIRERLRSGEWDDLGI